jgi:serine protease
MVTRGLLFLFIFLCCTKVAHSADPLIDVDLNANAGQVQELVTRMVVYRRSIASLTGPDPEPFSNGERVQLALPMTQAQAVAYATQLETDPLVNAVLIDRTIARHGTVTSNDTFSHLLWNMASGSVGTSNSEPVWATNQGAGTTVAVLDTGRVDHPDMANVWVPGYDLVSDLALAADGDARDDDPTDPMTCDNGNGPVATGPHGLMVGSVIAARLNNNEGIAGVAAQASIMPVRVISGCGGWLSDIADGMRWAAGLRVSGLPLNPSPAKILNFSLGSTAPDATCSRTMQAIVDEVKATGALIIASTGNDGRQSIAVPALCQGVIAVTAATEDGKVADYANVGPGTSIAAPGGGCATDAAPGCANQSSNYIALATINGSSPGYSLGAGTSFSAPHVAGAAALLLAQTPAATAGDIASAITNSARPYAPQVCSASTCGVGLLDVQAALVPEPFTLSAQSDTPNARTKASVSLRATVSDTAAAPTFQWQQTQGTTRTLSFSENDSVAQFIAPDTSESMSFRVTVTDVNGNERSANVAVNVSVAPVIQDFAPVTLEEGEALSLTITLDDGSRPEAIGVDESSRGKGIQVNGDQILWDLPIGGEHQVIVTAFDAFGPGTPKSIPLLVPGSSQQATNNPMGEGGAGSIGGHGALLLLLAFLMRRRTSILPATRK